MSAPPPGAYPPMRRRRAADAMPADAVRARNATTKTAAQLAALPPKKKGPPETTTLVTRRSVWGESEAGRCASGLHGKQGEPRWGHKPPDNAHQRSKLRITAKWATAQCLANTRFFRFLRRLAQPSNYKLLPYVQFVLTFCNDCTLSSDAPSAPMLCRRDISAVIRSRTLATSTETATFVAPEVSALKSPR